MTHSSTLSMVLVAMLVSVPGRAHARQDDPALEEARHHFQLGVDFYRERNFRAALIEFQRAYKTSPHYKLLYNLGQASLELQEDSAAISYFERYLKEGQSELGNERKQEVELEIERLRERLGTISISCNQPGAEIHVDNTIVGTSPLREPLKVSVGRRKLVAVKQGYPNAERVVDIAAGDHLNVTLEFKERAVVDVTKLQLAAAKPEPESGGMSAAAWSGIGTGLVAAGAATMSVMTALAQDTYDDELKKETSPTRLRDMRDDAKTKALVADVLWGATVAAAGITTVLLFAEGKSERAPDSQGVAVRIGPTSVGLSGKF